jgi:sRNA-binding carbon storage regulator CsrA
VLVLTTEPAGEKIYLRLPGGGEVVVTVQEVRGRRVRLGFVAPPEVAIYRESFRRRPDAPSPPDPAKPAR